MRMKFRFIILLAILAWIVSCNPISKGEYYQLQGFTQGTTYSISYQHPTLDDLQEEIDSILRVFDTERMYGILSQGQKSFKP